MLFIKKMLETNGKNGETMYKYWNSLNELI